MVGKLSPGIQRGNSGACHIHFTYFQNCCHVLSALWCCGKSSQFSSISSVTQSCLTLCDPMDCSMPGFPAYHQLLEPAQIHVHWVNDDIQLSHPLSSPSPPAFNLYQHQGLFQWVSSSHEVAQCIGTSASASVLPMNIQNWFLLGLIGLIPLQSKGLSRILSNTIVQQNQIFGAQLSLWPNSHIHT